MDQYAIDLLADCVSIMTLSNIFQNDSPFYSVFFLLPMLCQTTMEIEGCKDLVSSGMYKAVSFELLINLFSYIRSLSLMPYLYH